MKTKTGAVENRSDRIQQRQALAKIIRSFLNSEADLCDFEDQLDSFGELEDPVIRMVCRDLWYLYDDMQDEQPRLSKPGWDYVQRLLLLLETNSRIEITNEFKRFWSIKQLFAGTSLLAFMILALQIGISFYLLLLAIPFGLVSMLLSNWKTYHETIDYPYEPIIFPFATISDLERAYRSADFRKTQYPKHIADHSKRTWFKEVNQQFQTYLYWLIFSPFVLLFQAFPDFERRVRVYAS